MADCDAEYDIDMLASLLDDPTDDGGNNLTLECSIAPKASNSEIEQRSRPTAGANDNSTKPTTMTMSKVSTSEDLELELKRMQEKMTFLQQQLMEKKRTESQIKTPLKTSPKNVPKLQDVGLDIFLEKPSTLSTNIESLSSVHTGDTDSSDEDSNCDPMKTKYNEFGQFVRKRLAHSSKREEVRPSPEQTAIKLKQTSKQNVARLSNPRAQAEKSDQKETTDAYSGIRIINPRVSSTEMRERMTGRKMIRLSTIRMHIRGGDIDGDWVTIGVNVNKTEPKKSSNGNLYSIWKLCDLKDCGKIVSLFLFGNNHEHHWKTAVGSVVGLLNASIMPNKDSSGNNNNNDVCLTIDHPQKVMLMGVSKDFGLCKGRRKDGATCTMFVNKGDCEFCPFHVQKEYRKSSSKRMDLQTNFSGREPNALRAKILQNQEVMYGGQLYVNPRPDKTLKRIVKGKDKLTLNSLKLQKKATDLAKCERATINASHLSTQENKLANDIGEQCEAFGKMMCLPTAGSRNLFRYLKNEDANPKGSTNKHLPQVKSITPSELLKIHAKEMESMRASGNISSTKGGPTSTNIKKQVDAQDTPRLGKGLRPGETVVLLDARPSPSSTMDYAKFKAIQKIGKPIAKEDPNAIKPERNSVEFKEKIRKRLASESHENHDEEPEEKKQCSEKTNVLSEKVIEILNRKSKYENLAEDETKKRETKYFNEMEKKEQIETKMCSTMEMQCRAVSCKKCEYTAFSALETCRAEGHPLVVHKATKRFFKCKDCSRRTVSLSKLPNKPCSGCRGRNYENVAMCKERTGPKLENELLSIRGGEQTFVNSHCTENLNL